MSCLSSCSYAVVANVCMCVFMCVQTTNPTGYSNIFRIEDGSKIFLRNVGKYPSYYMAKHFRRRHSSLYIIKILHFAYYSFFHVPVH
jgi:hypothetical protein